MTSTAAYEALTPAQVEQKVTQAINALYFAQREFAVRRDGMTAAEIALKRAQRVAAARAECPKPSRGGVTVGERDSWIAAETAPEIEDRLLAEAALDIATSALRVQRDILSGLQTLARSVETAYRAS